MNEVSAAMGLTSLESLKEFVAVNQRNYEQYQQQLADISGIDLVSFNRTEKHNYQYIVLEVDEAVTHISRDDLQKILWAENVLARRYFYPGCHRMEPYSSYFPNAGLLLPNTERLVARVLSLPTGTSVSSGAIGKICHILRLLVSQGREVRERLRRQACESPTCHDG
jgi:dTDP-4-amino-4,6-dideoxygalactose transaminase